jgi:2-C-methyl-D-erythritol 2,4-cyclodiphosphate synthase
MDLRVGQGFDAHRFGPGDAIVIGGVTIPHTQGIVAHSDGDVLIHAICDALLGAAALGDIGQHFPDTDPALAGIDSGVLLRQTQALLDDLAWQLVNLDATVIAQAPRLAQYIPQMRDTLSELLSVEVGQVNLKATTTERLGFTGRGEGIAAQAAVLLSRQVAV